MDRATSKNNVPIRLTDERWTHFVENHDDLAGHQDNVLAAVAEPDVIIEGYGGALVALKKMTRKRFLVVVYKETTPRDGFIVTPYHSKKIKIENEVIVWERKL
jgi:hypothetical protein